MPYEYYALPFCKPAKFGLQSENLGEVLSGDRIENSVYKVSLLLKPLQRYYLFFKSFFSLKQKLPNHVK